jgi:hypothetical protein
MVNHLSLTVPVAASGEESPPLLGVPDWVSFFLFLLTSPIQGVVFPSVQGMKSKRSHFQRNLHAILRESLPVLSPLCKVRQGKPLGNSVGRRLRLALAD